MFCIWFLIQFLAMRATFLWNSRIYVYIIYIFFFFSRRTFPPYRYPRLFIIDEFDARREQKDAYKTGEAFISIYYCRSSSLKRN